MVCTDRSWNIYVPRQYGLNKWGFNRRRQPM